MIFENTNNSLVTVVCDPFTFQLGVPEKGKKPMFVLYEPVMVNDKWEIFVV